MTTTTRSDAAIEDFRQSWSFIRSMTYEFIDAVPAHCWHFSPHAGCGPLAKQFRHMVWISGLYNDALKNRVMDLSKKKTFYSGSLEKLELVSALRGKDAELQQVMADTDVVDARVEMPFLGRAMRFGEFTAMVVQHESLHQGMWALYARLGGFVTPQSWLFNWGL